MANRDDIDLGDLPFDDFGDDGEGGYGGGHQSGKKRTPIEKLTGTVKTGLKANLTSPSFYGKLLKRALPKEYQAMLEAADTGASSLRELYNIAEEEAKPLGEDLKRGVRASLPNAEKVLPKKLVDKLKKYAEKQGSDFGASSYDAEGNEIANGLTSVFVAYQEAQQKKEAEKTGEERVERVAQAKLQQGQLQLLLGISNSINRLVSYQDQVTMAYQKKSLELQYKHYFATRKLVDLSQQQLGLQKTSFESIVTNTALPEAVKIRNNEILGQIMKERFLSQVSEPFSKFTRSLLPKIMSKAGSSIKGFASSIGTSLGSMVSGMELAGAMGSDPDMRQSMTNDAIGDLLRMMLGGKMDKVQEYLSKNPTIAKLGIKGTRMIRNAPDMIAGGLRNTKRFKGTGKDVEAKMVEMRKQLYGFFGKTPPEPTVDPITGEVTGLGSGKTGDAIDKLIEKTLASLGKDLGVPTRLGTVRRSNSKEMDKAAYWTYQADRTLNEVIPGWLGKIHQELAITRTGDANTPELVFSHRTGKFETVSKAGEIAIGQVFSKKESKAVNEGIEETLKQIDPEKKLKPAARKALGRYLLTRANNFQDMDLGTLAAGSETGYPDSLMKYRTDISKFLQDRFEYTPQGKEGKSSVQAQTRLAQTEDRFSKLRENIPDIRNKLAEQSFQSNIRVLEAQGLVTYNDEEGTYEVNWDKVYDNFDGGVPPDEEPAPAAPGAPRRGRKKSRRPIDISQHGNRNRALGGPVRNYAMGSDGPVRGPGTSTSDSIPTNLSDGETVVNTPGSKIPGMGAFLKWLNRTGNAMRGINSSGTGYGGKGSSSQSDQLQDAIDRLTEQNSEMSSTLAELLETVRQIPNTPLQTFNVGEGMDPEDIIGGLSLGERISIKGVRGARKVGGAAYRGAKKLTSWGAKRIRKGFGGALGLIGSASSAAKTLGKKALGMVGFGLKKLEDVYIVGEDFPVMVAKNIRKGRYVDVLTKKVIEVPTDITGPVMDLETQEYVITQEDYDKGVYGKRSKKIFKRIAGLVGKLTGWVRKPFEVMKSILQTGKKLIGNVVRFGEIPYDIYVAGEDTPRIIARVMRQGGYRLKSTGKVVTKISQLTGDIVDEKNNVVLTVDDMRKGLVDSSGKPIRGLMSRLASGAAKIASVPIKLGKMALNAARTGADTLKKVLGGGLGLLKGLFSGAGFSLFGSTKPIISKLDAIYNVLNDRLPASKKKSKSNDSDGDGLRDGSWQEQEQAREKAKKEGRFGKLLDALKNGKEKVKEKGASIFDSLKNMLPMLVTGATALFSKISGTVKLITSFLGKGSIKALMKTASVVKTGAKFLGSGLGKAVTWGVRALPFLAEGAAALASGAVAVLTSPVTLTVAAVAAVAYGGYKLYKYYNQPNSPIAKFRMAQYGFASDDEKHVPKLIELEQALLKVVQVSASGPATLGKGVSVQSLLQIFGVNEKDPKQVEKWISWFTGRFKPVFLSHVTIYYGMTKKKDITKADTTLTTAQKLDYLPKVNFPSSGNSPYVYRMSPFGDEEKIPLDDDDDVTDAYDAAVSLAKRNATANDAAVANQKGVKPGATGKVDKDSGGVWDSTKKAAGAAWDSVKNGFNNAVAGAASGIDYLKKGYNKAVDVASAGIEKGVAGAKAVGEGIAAGAESAVAFGQSVGNGVKNLVAKVDSNALYQNILKYASMAGVTTPAGMAMYLGQMFEESGGFKVVSENLHYKVDTMMNLFSRAKSAGRAAVEQVVKAGPAAIAEFLYGGRMGNDQPGDGWKYRGRGPLQLTGKGNYAAAGKALGLDLVGNPDLLLDPDIGAKASAWYFKTRVSSNALNSGDLRKVTKAVNGGYINIDKRSEAYKAFLAKIGNGTLETVQTNPAKAGSPSAATPDKAQPAGDSGAALAGLKQSAKPSASPSGTNTAPPVVSAVGSAASKSPPTLPAPTTAPGTAQVAQAKQSEQQRKEAASNAVNMDAVAAIMRDQLNVQKSMDAKLGNIDATLLRIEKSGPNGKAGAAGSPPAPAVPSGKPPVSMLKV